MKCNIFFLEHLKLNFLISLLQRDTKQTEREFLHTNIPRNLLDLLVSLHKRFTLSNTRPFLFSQAIDETMDIVDPSTTSILVQETARLSIREIAQA